MQSVTLGRHSQVLYQNAQLRHQHQFQEQTAMHQGRLDTVLDRFNDCVARNPAIFQNLMESYLLVPLKPEAASRPDLVRFFLQFEKLPAKILESPESLTVAQPPQPAQELLARYRSVLAALFKKTLARAVALGSIHTDTDIARQSELLTQSACWLMAFAFVQMPAKALMPFIEAQLHLLMQL